MQDSEPDNAIGSVDLNRSAKLVFSVRSWKGRQLAHVRKFVSSPKYTGPTPSGIAMSGAVLVGVIDALAKLQVAGTGIEQKEFSRVSKRGEVDIVIGTVPPDDLKALPSVDVREFVHSDTYNGPTKKGVRFTWEKLPDVLAFLRIAAEQLGEQAASEPNLFPTDKPQWVEKSEASRTEPLHQSDPVLAAVLPSGPKCFPTDFVEYDQVKCTETRIPPEPLEVAQRPGGKHVVRTGLGFELPIRNAAEGNFIIYAQMKLQSAVHVPVEMIAVFRAVKAYENYLRELRHSLVQGYERKLGHRPMAEHQAQQVFRRYGLPWINQS